MTSSLRLIAATALAALAALTALAVPAAASGPASARTDFKVLWVVSTGSGVYLSQDHVGATLYTIDLHNVGAYPARFTITVPGSKLLDVTVKPGGWRFVRVRFKPATYSVKVTTRPGPTTYAASLPSQ
jgi:hypothetical protein